MGKSNRAPHRIISCVVVVALLGVLPVVASTAATASPPPTFDAFGSAEQVDVTGLTPGEQVVLLDSGGTTVATLDATSLGGALFRNVTPGTGYVVKTPSDGSESLPLTVHSNAPAPWDSSLYDQPIANNGYQYLTTRDGTQLAIDVHLPLGANPKDKVQYPTLIEYAGYGYADPSGGESSIALVANAMGFAVVDVNMRGTGCSGGAFDFFEPLQQLDAYDVIETIAKQSWVSNHKVGMFGISYGGISQLFAAQNNPPSLAAIAPLSVIDATASTLYPGGTLNTGFALSWAQGRVDDAKPAGPHSGESYAWKQIQNGDKVCEANQVLHASAVDLIAKVRANTHYDPAVADPIDPVSFVHKIHVPVFMACQFEDEQTGGHCPELVQHMTGTTHKWFTFTNGSHIDSLDPATLNRMYDFLEIYVAQQPPTTNMYKAHDGAPFIYKSAMGLPDGDTINLPDDPIQGKATLADAKSAFEALPEVTIAFDNGAGTSPDNDTTPGNPYAGFTKTFSTLPVPGTQARSWYLGPDGKLGDQPPAGDGVDTYTSDASALPLTDYTGKTGGGGLWGNASQWQWNWQQNPAGKAVSYVSAPLTKDTTVVGAGAVYVWVKSSTPDVDLQATISEVRPDGKETFVQNGWIRASERKLSTGSDNVFKRPSTLLDPVPTFTTADSAPMPAGQFVKVAIPLYYQGHAYRAGSRIRVVIAAPNGTQPVWAFGETEPPSSTSQVALAYSPSMPSRLVLPVVPDGTIPTALPVCPSLRNEPCRTYEPFVNQSSYTPPTTSTTSTTSTTAPSATAPSTTAATGSSSPSDQTSGQLPSTGIDVRLLAALAAMATLAGAGLVLTARRRRSMGRA